MIAYTAQKFCDYWHYIILLYSNNTGISHSFSIPNLQSTVEVIITFSELKCLNGMSFENVSEFADGERELDEAGDADRLTEDPDTMAPTVSIETVFVIRPMKVRIVLLDL